MIKILLIVTTLFFSACVNKHGVSAKYYSDCKEYYDVQGYYHKDCNGDVVTYKEMGEATKKAYDYVVGEEEVPKGNVW